MVGTEIGWGKGALVADTSDSHPPTPNFSGTDAARDRSGRLGGHLWWTSPSKRGIRLGAMEPGPSTPVDAATLAPPEGRQAHDPSFNDSMMQHLELKGTSRGTPDSFFSFWGGSSPSTFAQGILLLCCAAVVIGVSSTVIWIGHSHARLDDLHAAVGVVTTLVVLALVVASSIGLIRLRRKRQAERRALREWSAEHHSPPDASSTHLDP
jgi:hypothetical protein